MRSYRLVAVVAASLLTPAVATAQAAPEKVAVIRLLPGGTLPKPAIGSVVSRATLASAPRPARRSVAQRQAAEKGIHRDRHVVDSRLLDSPAGTAAVRDPSTAATTGG